jgi:uncharacterized membrane protein
LGVVTTFALGDSSASHLPLLFLMLLFFLVLEGRRFCSWVASAVRILNMEQFFRSTSRQSRKRDMLQEPTPTLSQSAAIA